MAFRFFCGGILALAVTASAPAALAQADPLAQAFRNCTDGNVTLEKRLTNCKIAIAAKGLEPVEIGFAYIDLGLVYQEMHDDDSALAAFNKGLEASPGQWQGLADRAYLYLRRNDLEHALADYKALDGTDPDGAVVNIKNVGEYRPVTNGEVHNYDSPTRDSEARRDAIVKVRDGIAVAFANRCRAKAVNPADAATAMTDCETALSISPNLPAALVSRGFVEFVRGDYRAAARDLAYAPPDAAVPIYLRGVARHRLSDPAYGADIAEAEKIRPGITAQMTSGGLAP
ncbi:MAG TPA: hypothetical protein VMU22_12100 [Rhizomicrobium sp.]|nr:hypothetical protein [Rhizomicrobium sp.]